MWKALGGWKEIEVFHAYLKQHHTLFPIYINLKIMIQVQRIFFYKSNKDFGFYILSIFFM